jgi:hypothetical protein
MNFLDILTVDHGGKVRVEIDLAHSRARHERNQLVHVELWIRLLLGSPKLIGNELVFAVDLQAMGSYTRRLDGPLTNKQIGKLVLQRALDFAWRGASVLLDAKPTTPLVFEGMRLADSGRLVDILELQSKKG